MHRLHNEVVRRMRRAESTCEELTTEEGEMRSDGEKASFGMEMVDRRQAMTTRHNAHSGVLDTLKFFDRRRTRIGEPDGCRVSEERANQRLVGGEHRLLPVTPAGARKGLKNL